MSEEVRPSTSNSTQSGSAESSTIFTEATMRKLSEAFTSSFQPSLGNTKQQLSELLQKQGVLLDELHEENLKVSWTQNSVELQKMFDVISTYHSKLTAIKKDMKHLHDRNNKLKKRAHRLQEYKHKLESIRKLSKEFEFEREQALISCSDPRP